MGRTKTVNEEIEKQVIYNYLELKQGLQSAGRNFNLSQYMVEKILKKYGVKKRTYTEAKQEGRKYTCEDNYFKTQSSNMAYILGLLASDGSVSKKENLIAIQLLATDKEILEKIKEETKSQRPLESYIRKNTGHEIVSFRVWSKTWKNDLAHYGIIPEKTFKLVPPYLLNDEYNIDYIRGYFDGDGSIYHIKQDNRVFVEIAGASKEIIEWIQDKLINQYHIIINRPLIETLPNGTKIYKIKIGSKEEIKKLYKLFYHNDTLYMQRKKNKFHSLLNIPRDFNSSNEE